MVIVYQSLVHIELHTSLSKLTYWSLLFCRCQATLMFLVIKTEKISISRSKSTLQEVAMKLYTVFRWQAREYIWKISIYSMQTSQANRRLGAQRTKVHDQLQVDNTNFYSNLRVVNILGDLESSSKFEKISWWVSGFSELSTPASISEIITPIIKDTFEQ